MAINVGKYNIILDKLGEDVSDFNIQTITTKVPSPTNDDYRVGFIERYFIQKANDPNSYIYEVGNNYYSIITDNPFYIKARVKWKITGNKEEVRVMNRKSISYASKDMKKISLYLPNYLQFYKERV